ncbi:MAG: hypothetical protein M3O64_06350 [Chloroflexota bacterium]|nr:hypothetical protein [Chloroflexota bacterium]
MATDSSTFRLTPPRPPSAHPAVDQHAVQFYEKDDFLPTETYVELDPDDRLRAVAELQQRVIALEAALAARTSA